MDILDIAETEQNTNKSNRKVTYTILEQARKDVKDFYRHRYNKVQTLLCAIMYGIGNGTNMVPFLRELSIGENVSHDIEAFDKCLELIEQITKMVTQLKTEIGLDLTATQMDVADVYPSCPRNRQNYEEHLSDTCEPLWPIVGDSIKVMNPNTDEPIKLGMARQYIVLQEKLTFGRDLTEADQQFIDEHKDMFYIRGK